MPDGGSRHSSEDKAPSAEVHPAITNMHIIEDNINKAITSHVVNDPNLDPGLIEMAQEAIDKGDEKAELRLEDVLEDDSIYPEVRAAVSNVDDPSMPVNTFRAWFLGLIACILIAGINEFFIFQFPIITIQGIVAQLVTYPMGKAMEKIPYPSHWPLAWFFNPGPFNVKEHTLITVMATVSVGAAYATDVFAVQKVYYGQETTFGYQILLTLSTQLFGFALAGVSRQWLVWPAAMIWPSNLPTCALMSTLHHTQEAEAGRWSRNRMFYTVFTAIFFWEWVPTYLFQGLSMFSWPAWAAPNNIGVNLVFGGGGGIGFNFLTLDWSVITTLGSPLYTPWFAEANVFVGYLIVIAFAAPILWSQNIHYGAYLPFYAASAFDRFGNAYSSTYVLTPDKILDVDKYMTYSKQYLPTSFLLSYGFGFAAITATLSHVGIYYGKDIYRQLRRSLKDEPDIHARLMSVYVEVPQFWYLAVGLAAFGMAVPAVYCYPTDMPVWALVFAIVLGTLYTIPIGIIQAITANQVGLNVISEMIIGYILPGRPVAMMLFKCYTYMVSSPALLFPFV